MLNQSRLREVAEEYQGALLELKARESDLVTVQSETSTLTRKLDDAQQSSNRARSEAGEWKALAER